MSSKKKIKITLLPHEKKLLATGELEDVTHHNASSRWLEAKSYVPNSESVTTVYRPMADAELLYLLEHAQLPDTQPYQTIVQGQPGLFFD